MGELCDLYDKIKADIPIQSVMDDGSTATLSNCGSLSPRMSPNGLSPNDNMAKDEIHYFAEEKEDESDNEEDDDLMNTAPNNKKYKDSPRPFCKELKLPQRQKQSEDDFDLLSNAKSLCFFKKKEFPLPFFKKKKKKKKKKSNRKRKYDQISKEAELEESAPAISTTSSYIANRFEIGQCLTSSDGIHQKLSNYLPP